MSRVRLIGVVTVKDGIAVQSFSFNHYLPLGKPEYLVENLDRWGADEILVNVIDRSVKGRGPDVNLLDRLSSLGFHTPLIYGGGIKDAEDAALAIKHGADRILLDTLLTQQSNELASIRNRIGKQAIIGSLPIVFDKGVNWIEYKSGDPLGPVQTETLEQIRSYLSELLLIDCKNEGKTNSFDKRLVERFPQTDIPLLLFGGLTNVTQYEDLIRYSSVNGFCVGNSLNYREHAVQKIKLYLQPKIMREPQYHVGGDNQYG